MRRRNFTVKSTNRISRSYFGSTDGKWLLAVVAIALLVVCDLKAARKYPITANAMDAAGIAILFATFFAAHSLWNLISGTTAFALLALVGTRRRTACGGRRWLLT